MADLPQRDPTHLSNHRYANVCHLLDWHTASYPFASARHPHSHSHSQRASNAYPENLYHALGAFRLAGQPKVLLSALPCSCETAQNDGVTP